MPKLKWTRVSTAKYWTGIVVMTRVFGEKSKQSIFSKRDNSIKYVFLCNACGHQEVLTRYTPISHRLLHDGNLENLILQSVHKTELVVPLEPTALGVMCCPTAQGANEIMLSLVDFVEPGHIYEPGANKHGFYNGELMSRKLKRNNHYTCLWSDHFTVMVKTVVFDYVFNRKALKYIPVRDFSFVDKFTTSARGTFMATHFECKHKGKHRLKRRFTNILFAGPQFQAQDNNTHIEPSTNNVELILKIRKAMLDVFAPESTTTLESIHDSRAWRLWDYAIEKYIPGFHATYGKWGGMLGGCGRTALLRFLRHMAAKRPRTPRALASCFVMPRHVKPSVMRLIQSFLNSTKSNQVETLYIASCILKDTNLVVRLADNADIPFMFGWGTGMRGCEIDQSYRQIIAYLRWIANKMGESAFVTKMIEFHKQYNKDGVRRGNLPMLIQDGARMWKELSRTNLLSQIEWKFDFEHLHDEMSRLQEIMRRGPDIDIVPSKHQEKWNAKYGKYEVFVPAHTGILAGMGKKLKNCIGSYRTEVLDGRCQILGIKEDGHLVAAFEIRDGQVRQFYQACNKHVEPGSHLMYVFGKWCMEHKINPGHWYNMPAVYSAEQLQEALAC